MAQEIKLPEVVLEAWGKLERERDYLRNQLDADRKVRDQAIQTVEDLRQELESLKKAKVSNKKDQQLEQARKVSANRLAENTSLKEQIKSMKEQVDKTNAEVRDMQVKLQEQDRVLKRVLQDKENVVKHLSRLQK